MPELPIEPINRIIRNAGAHRVSKDASLELVNYLEGISKRASRKAVRYTKHARRKTVRRKDILLALGSVPSQRVSTRRAFMTPIKPITRAIRNAGAHRVSKDASLELVNYLENSSTIISKKAVSIAKHAGRKTVKREDIENAILEFGPGPFGE